MFGEGLRSKTPGFSWNLNHYDLRSPALLRRTVRSARKDAPSACIAVQLSLGADPTAITSDSGVNLMKWVELTTDTTSLTRTRCRRLRHDVVQN